MCTVIMRLLDEPDASVRLLALRDEDDARAFDDPGAWWPEQGGVIGGRDRTAGGTWCVTDVATGMTALVLNRPERRSAAPGAASRGLLPLLALEHGPRWSDAVDTTPMASFILLLVGPGQRTRWDFDGTALRESDLPVGTSMVTSGGAEDDRTRRHRGSFVTAEFPTGWLDIVTAAAPADDPAALLVRHPFEGRVWATVFGQLLDIVPGRLTLTTSRTPSEASSWRRSVVSAQS